MKIQLETEIIVGNKTKLIVMAVIYFTLKWTVCK
jgi:hypothetical protein